MAKAAKKPDPVVDDSDHRSKHEDVVGVQDVQNDNRPAEAVIPDEDAGFEDADALELEEARKAAEADAGTVPAEGDKPAAEPAATPNPAAQPATADQPGAKAAEPAAADTDQQSQISIPKARFDEVLSESRKREQEAAYWKGVAEARGQIMNGADAPAAPAQPVKTPEERIADARAKRLDLAQKYEAGEINVVDWQTQADAIEDEIFQIRSEAMRPQQQVQPQTSAQIEDLYLAEQTAKLYAEHPYIEKLDDPSMNYIIARARHELGYGNRELESSLEVLQLRTKVAELSDRLGPAMVGEIQPASQQQPQPQPGQMTETAQQRQAKLALAQQHPLDIQTMGQGAEPNGDPTPDQIVRMSDEEIAALPASTRARMMEKVR